MPRRVATALILAVAVVVIAGVVVWQRLNAPSEVSRAAALAPAGTQRVLWTDWAGVRQELGVSSDGSAGSADRLARLLDRGFEADLTPMSALLTSAEPMRAGLGLSPATLEWELYSQSTRGASLVMAAPESLDLSRLGERLERLGYQRPDEPTGLWDGGPEVAANAGFNPELQYVVLLADEHLVVASDRASYAERTAAVALGEQDGVEGLEDVVAALHEPLAAVAQTGEYTCEHAAMAGAEGPEEQEAATLVRAAGGVHPLQSFAMAAQPGRSALLAMTFETEDQARADADARARLASGPAPGQGGDFTDRFSLGTVRAEGTLLTMRLRPRPGAYVLSDLSSGPLLLASC